VRTLFTHLFGSHERRQRTDRLLKAITVQARLPAFYEELGVPDTLDGRFDLMALHGFLVFRALQGRGREGRVLAQDTTDLMFSAFDDAIRSLGVGDMGVPKRVKTMAKAYFGRSEAYDAALKADDREALGEAIRRNIYRGAEVDPGKVSAVADYVAAEAGRLGELPLERFQQGDLGFGPAPEVKSP